MCPHALLDLCFPLQGAPHHLLQAPLHLQPLVLCLLAQGHPRFARCTLYNARCTMQEVARGALMDSLNMGADVTKGLRKVDKSEMTHKNPALRGQRGSKNNWKN